MNKKAFTFVEVIIAVTIFLIFITVIIKLTHKSNESIREISNKIKMTYIAQAELEKYKNIDNDSLGLSTYNNKIIDGYHAKLSTRIINDSYIDLVEVTIEVSIDDIFGNDDDVIIQNHVIDF